MSPCGTFPSPRGGTGKGPAAAGGQYNSQVSTGGNMHFQCFSLNVYHLRKNVKQIWVFFQVAKKKSIIIQEIHSVAVILDISFPGFPTTSSHCRWENQPWINRIKVDHWGCSFLHLGDVTLRETWAPATSLKLIARGT